MKCDSTGKSFFFMLLGGVAVFTLAIFWNFLVTIILGASLSIILYPVFIWIRNHITKGVSWIASLITLILFFIVLSTFLFFIGSKVLSEAQFIYVSLSNGDLANSFFDDIFRQISSLSQGTISELDIKNKIESIVTYLSGSILTIFSVTLQTAFSVFLMFISLFYFLKDGQSFCNYIVSLSPLSKDCNRKILTMLVRSVNGVVKGYLLIALIQGTLIGLGLWVAGVPNASLWGVLAGLGSLIPSVGTIIVTAPAVLYLGMSGDTLSAVGFGLWSFGLVGGIDNILNPFIVGNSVELPPLVVLFSVLGGISLLGAVGIIVGPLVASLLHTLLTIYKEDFQNQS